MSVDLYGPEFFVGRSATVIASAAVVVPVIVEILAPQDALDVGCGQGEWVAALASAGVDAWGVDIAAPDAENLARCDLTERLDLGRTFDLILCLETGEHLPESAADTLVDSICRHGGAVVFSAAVPGQEGKGHINCQPHEYWHKKFRDRDYEVADAIRPLIRNNPAVSPWYKENIFVYW